MLSYFAICCLAYSMILSCRLSILIPAILSSNNVPVYAYAILLITRFCVSWTLFSSISKICSYSLSTSSFENFKTSGKINESSLRLSLLPLSISWYLNFSALKVFPKISTIFSLFTTSCKSGKASLVEYASGLHVWIYSTPFPYGNILVRGIPL